MVQQALGELVRSKTVIVIAHRLATIKQADQIIVMQDGAVVQSGDHASLSTCDGLYQHLWASRQAAAEWSVR